MWQRNGLKYFTGAPAKDSINILQLFIEVTNKQALTKKVFFGNKNIFTGNATNTGWNFVDTFMVPHAENEF